MANPPQAAGNLYNRGGKISVAEGVAADFWGKFGGKSYYAKSKKFILIKIQLPTD